MKYIVYILYSDSIRKHYIGHTSNLENRLNKHNNGLVRSTKTGVPWKIVYTESFSTKQEAYRREIKIKSYKGGQAFKGLIK